MIKSENLTFPMYMFLSEIIAMADIDAKIKAQGDKIFWNVRACVSVFAQK